MGLGKFWLRHGPGSPGATAKAIAKDFMVWKKEYPKASKDALLEQTLMNRIKFYGKHGIDLMTPEEQVKVLKRSDGKLAGLVIQLIHHENPEASKAQANSPDIYQAMLEVVFETISLHAPGVDGIADEPNRFGADPVAKMTHSVIGSNEQSSDYELASDRAYNPLPEKVQCLHCNENVKLTEVERRVRKFICAECGKANDRAISPL